MRCDPPACYRSLSGYSDPNYPEESSRECPRGVSEGVSNEEVSRDCYHRAFKKKEKKNLPSKLSRHLPNTPEHGPQRPSGTIPSDTPSDTHSDTFGNTLRDNSDPNGPRDSCSRLGDSPPLRLHPSEQNASTDHMGQGFTFSNKKGKKKRGGSLNGPSYGHIAAPRG